MTGFSKFNRPLSPHLQIYRFTVLMASSILHRITGAANYAGTLLIAAWVIALMLGPEIYGQFLAIALSWPGLIILFGYTWTLIHHMLGGVRHLVWDTGKALDVPTARRMALLNYIGGFLLTLLVWAVAIYERSSHV